MLLRLQRSLSSMTGLVRQQEQTANNLANINTIGFKRDRSFQEALAERFDSEGSPVSTVALRQAADLSQGPLEPTGNPLDLAISGEGFFSVTDENGDTRYTRGGRFVLDDEGVLRTPTGLMVDGTGGSIQLPLREGPPTISQNGEIRVGNQTVGQLRMVTFDAPEQLRRMDAATFADDGQFPNEMESPRIMQGFIEASNVNSLSEMTDMISHTRFFEAQQRWLTTTDQVLGRVTGELGRF